MIAMMEIGNQKFAEFDGTFFLVKTIQVLSFKISPKTSDLWFSHMPITDLGSFSRCPTL